MALYKLKFHPSFLKELELAIAYYTEQSPKAGDRFKLAVSGQLKAIKKSPLFKTIRYDDIRFARIEKFPYAIHYSIDRANKIVMVQCLLSDYQNPINWAKRF